MMKRAIAVLLIMAIFVSFIPIQISAEEQNRAGVICLDDGSYIMESISEYGPRLTGHKTGSKTYDYYGSDGKLKWSAEVCGNFMYNGTTSSCTASNVTVTIYDDQWVVVSKQASHNRNTATGEIVMGKTRLGATVGTVNYSLSVSCDPNGNLS